MAKRFTKADLNPTADGCLFYPEKIRCNECREPGFDAWRCEHCGWNPTVHAKRMAAIKENTACK